MCTEGRALCQLEILFHFRRENCLKNSYTDFYLTVTLFDIGDVRGAKRLCKGAFSIGISKEALVEKQQLGRRREDM